MNEEIRPAVVGCDEAETRLTVESLDDSVVNRIHGYQHRFDVEVLGDRHHSSSVLWTHRFHSHFGGIGTKVINRRGRRPSKAALQAEIAHPPPRSFRAEQLLEWRP